MRTITMTAKESSVSFQREWHARFTWSKSCDLWSPNPHLHSWWLLLHGWFCQVSDCMYLLLAKQLHDQNEKPKANFICIDQRTSQRAPSQSMLPYCKRSMFTTAQTGTVRTNPPGPSGSHLIPGATKLSLQPLGLTYNQSEYQKRFDRLNGCQNH